MALEEVAQLDESIKENPGVPLALPEERHGVGTGSMETAHFFGLNTFP